MTDAPQALDPLGESLHLVQMNGVFYGWSELSAPWGVTLPAMPDHLWFHVLVSGSLRLDAGAGEAVLQRGDLALVPRGSGHCLRSEAGVAVPELVELEHEKVSDRYEILRHGGGGEVTTLVCGAVHFAHPAARTLLALLPAVVVVAASNSSEMQRIQNVVGLIADEAREPRAGGGAVITRLADVLVIQAIRTWMETDPAARTGWLGALRDPQIGRAITLIHRDPAREWTVASLAADLAMSRSSFAARFGALVGEPVMQYVTRWRMQVAYDALRAEDVTVAHLADRLGYRSEAAFSRAFKRVVGTSPGAVRRLDADQRDVLPSLWES